MTQLRLLLTSLSHFRLASLAVIAGVAVATAVLTGALMVGDSVRHSLRQLALDRLGPIDYALISPRLFPDDLARRLANHPAFSREIETLAPGLSLRGSAADENASTRISGLHITALADFIPIASDTCLLNAPVADTLNIPAPGPTITLSLPNLDDTPRDASLARRSRTDVLTGLRLRVAEIARGRSMPSLFSLAPSQRLPSNIFLNLNDLQNTLDQPARANLLLAKSRSAQSTPATAQLLNNALRQVATFADYGLELTRKPNGSDAILSSRSTYIPPAVDRAAEETAQALNIPLRRTLVYLINHVTRESNQPTTIHYAIAAGLNQLEDGSTLADDEIALNQWAADQLHAKIGDRIRLDYYQRQSNGDLKEIKSDTAFRVAKILPMTGLAADPALTPTYKGLTDADSVANWEPPDGLDIDKKLVTPEDEAYWNKHKAAPKLFLSLNTARRLWGSAYGDLNTLRLPAHRADEFTRELLSRLDPKDMGLAFFPIKAQQLAAASGSTDFSMLFIGFSFFLIASAALLVAMLFRLTVEQRARQFGLLSALGFAPKTLRNLALAEGLLLATAGGLLGTAAAIAYTALMMAGLRTWWLPAVGTTALHLHILPSTLTLGLLASLLLASLAILWSTRRLSRAHPSSLLSGSFRTPSQGQSPLTPSPFQGQSPLSPSPCTQGEGRGEGQTLQPPPRPHSPPAPSPILHFAFCILHFAFFPLRFAPPLLPLAAALTLLLLGTTARLSPNIAFLSAGAFLLISCLLALATQLNPSRSSNHLSLPLLSLRNATRHRPRSLLTISLIALATFTLVTVASMKQGPPANTTDPSSGAGGFPLILQADLPLLGDLNTEKGRDLLGIRATDSPLWSKARFLPLRRWAGQDASCLNLTRPDSPTILGVPQTLIDRNPFTFSKTLHKTPNPWQLLSTPGAERSDAPDSAPDIPIIADHETAQYILKLSLGDTLPITDQTGRPRNLKLVATLSHSIFQSELLMSEANFLRLFPSQSGHGTVLIEADPHDLPDLRRLLSTELDEFSVTVEPTADRLARYQEVANTYLSTFQTLGALGLMLGTIGLAVVLLRNLLERRAELALLAALGFTPRDRRKLVLFENLFLLLLGLFAGALCALVAILPTVLTSARALNWAQLAGALGAVFGVGLGALWGALGLSAGSITPADLRPE